MHLSLRLRQRVCEERGGERGRGRGRGRRGGERGGDRSEERRGYILPDPLNLDVLLVDDAPKPKAKAKSIKERRGWGRGGEEREAR